MIASSNLRERSFFYTVSHKDELQLPQADLDSLAVKKLFDPFRVGLLLIDHRHEDLDDRFRREDYLLGLFPFSGVVPSFHLLTLDLGLCTEIILVSPLPFSYNAPFFNEFP